MKYNEVPKKIKSNDFWDAIKNQKVTEYESIERRNGRGELVKNEQKSHEVPLFIGSLINQVEEARDLFLNPLSHSEIVTPIPSEIKKALEALVALEKRLKEA